MTIIELRPKRKEEYPFMRTLFTKAFSYQALLTAHLPWFSMKRKRDIFEKALKIHREEEGELRLTRCIFEFESGDSGSENNSTNDSKTALAFQKHDIQLKTDDGFFDYSADTSTARRSVWYLNFADPHVFAYWDSTLFAQDEMQALEHPLICALRNYMEAHEGKEGEDFSPCTMEYHRNGVPIVPTPILVENVPHWISINTAPKLADGTTANIYGNRFMFAPQAAVDAGVRVDEGLVRSNILAMAALPASSGEYSKAEIEYTFEAALAGFAQAASIAQKEKKDIAIHTGNWGCGAFGGNREFMYLVQLIAAVAVGISEIVFHGIDREIMAQAEEKLTQFLNTNDFTFESAVNFLIQQKYHWGCGDGN